MCPTPARHPPASATLAGQLQCLHTWQWRAGCLVCGHCSLGANQALAGGEGARYRVWMCGACSTGQRLQLAKVQTAQIEKFETIYMKGYRKVS